MLNDGDIKAAIRLSIDEINRSLESYERIGNFALVDADFPPDVRSVTVFQKIKVDRRAVEEQYKELINAMYSIAPLGGSAWLRWP